jgi:hypothetical protein
LRLPAGRLRKTTTREVWTKRESVSQIFEDGRWPRPPSFFCLFSNRLAVYTPRLWSELLREQLRNCGDDDLLPWAEKRAAQLGKTLAAYVIGLIRSDRRTEQNLAAMRERRRPREP